MRLVKSILIVIVFVFNSNPRILAQDNFAQHQRILIFDPYDVSAGFQYSFSQLSNHSIFLTDTIDENIDNFDALFLFIEYPYILSQDEGNSLIDYLNLNKPLYLSTNLWFQKIDSVAFWGYIGIDFYAELLIEVHVNYVAGVDSEFTNGVFIDTSFISGGVPVIDSSVVPILDGIDTVSLNLSTTFIPEDTSLNVIVDLYRMIHHPEFLERVIDHFGLNEIPLIQFYPPVDTAWMAGGCVGIDLIAQNLISTSVRDSIIIKPGSNSIFFYYDQQGNQVFVDHYYFIAIDSLNQFEYELWYHPKTSPPYNPVKIIFDSTFYVYDNFYDIQLLVRVNNNPIDSLSQLFRGEWGLGFENEEIVPETFKLYQNYPNPFNPSTKIKFTIPNDVILSPAVGGINSAKNLVTLKIYDVLGNEIATLINEEKPAGSYEVEFNAIGLPSGVYFYQLRAGRFIDTKKLILLK